MPITVGCVITCAPGERRPDGGVCQEESDDGFCPESKRVVCEGGYCQHVRYVDGGEQYDLYGPSDFKGNRSQGPGIQ